MSSPVYKPCIVHIITALHTGGAERMLAGLSHAWADKADFHVIYLKNIETTKPLFHPDTTFHYIPLGIGTISQLRKLLLSLHPTIIHTHLGHADLLGHLAAIGLPVRRWVTMHNAAFRPGLQDGLFFVLYKLLFRLFSPRVQFVAISKSVATFLVDKLHINQSRVHVIYNPLATFAAYDKVASKAGLGYAAATTLFLALGRLEYQKAPDVLIDAIALLPEETKRLIHLVFAGEGTMANQLKAKVESLNLSDTITFVGRVNDPSLYLHAADALLLPSRFEGFGNVILEAFSAGTPVIASALEGPQELIRPGETGILHKPADAQAIAQAIVAFLELSPWQKKMMGAQAKKIATTWQTPTSYADALWQLYSN